MFLCVDSPANVAIFEELKALDAKAEALDREFRGVAEKIERVKLR